MMCIFKFCGQSSNPTWIKLFGTTSGLFPTKPHKKRTTYGFGYYISLFSATGKYLAGLEWCSKISIIIALVGWQKENDKQSIQTCLFIRFLYKKMSFVSFY